MVQDGALELGAELQGVVLLGVGLGEGFEFGVVEECEFDLLGFETIPLVEVGAETFVDRVEYGGEVVEQWVACCAGSFAGERLPRFDLAFGEVSAAMRSSP